MNVELDSAHRWARQAQADVEAHAAQCPDADRCRDLARLLAARDRAVQGLRVWQED